MKVKFNEKKKKTIIHFFYHENVKFSLKFLILILNFKRCRFSYIETKLDIICEDEYCMFNLS